MMLEVMMCSLNLQYAHVLVRDRGRLFSFKQHKISTLKHKTIRTTTDVSSWNDQEYKSTGGLNRFTGA